MTLIGNKREISARDARDEGRARARGEPAATGASALLTKRNSESGLERSDKNYVARPTTRRAACLRCRTLIAKILNVKRCGASNARDKRKRKGRPATGRPSLSRENSSNGVSKKTIRTFWRNLIGPRKAVSRNFSRINAFVFNNLISLINMLRQMTKNVTFCFVRL